jgi:hypothetical protein
MKWAYSIRRKISAALLLAAIFVLIFAKSILDSNYVTQLGSSFASVYEDRLLVESYIYRLSDHLFRKKILVDTCSSEFSANIIEPMVTAHNSAIDEIIIQYENTKLTEAESRYFKDFKENIRALQLQEKKFFSADLAVARPISPAKVAIDKHFDEASGNLRQLSGIQISEGKMLNDHSKKIVAGASLLTQFEIAIVIVIGLIILVLVFESNASLIRTTQKPGLN